MKALVYLYYLRIKGIVRSMFSKVSTAIFTCVMLLIYGGLFIIMLNNGAQSIYAADAITMSMAVLIGIGCTAFMVITMLLQKRKALFMEPDAFYLFTGPFPRTSIMRFIMLQSLVSSLLCGALSIFMLVILMSGVAFDFWFLGMCFIGHTLVYMFFLVLYYYLYLLSIKEKKYQHLSWYILAIFLLFVAVAVIGIFIQNGCTLHQLWTQLFTSKLLYAVPLFGWLKLMLEGYVQANMSMMLSGAFLIIIACFIMYRLMLRYDFDFIEQAMQDAGEFSRMYEEMRAGKRMAMSDKKVRNVRMKGFREGAAAIMSKSFLEMRKGNSFISTQDIILLAIYFAVSFFLDMGLWFFVYMMMFWLFSSIQAAEFMRELDYYHIYLIPERPGKKLFYLLAPYLLKYVVLVAFPLAIAAIITHATLLEFIQYYCMLAGYACLFITASVLATRLLKSRKNAFMENMLRMLMLVAAAIPSIVIIFVLFSSGLANTTMMYYMSVLTLVVNVVLSIVILYGCKNMLNGREIKSE